jgi:hypothetical protein
MLSFVSLQLLQQIASISLCSNYRLFFPNGALCKVKPEGLHNLYFNLRSLRHWDFTFTEVVNQFIKIRHLIKCEPETSCNSLKFKKMRESGAVFQHYC